MSWTHVLSALAALLLVAAVVLARVAGSRRVMVARAAALLAFLIAMRNLLVLCLSWAEVALRPEETLYYHFTWNDVAAHFADLVLAASGALVLINAPRLAST